MLTLSLSLSIIISLAAGTLVAGLLYFRQRDYEQKWLVFLLFGLRALGFSLLLFVLIAPFIVQKERQILKPIVTILVDNSQSMLFGPDSASVKRDLTHRLAETSEGLENAEVRFYNFDANLSEAQPDFTGGATDMAQALQTVKREIPRDRLGAIVLASDGLYNRGNNPLYEAGSGLVPIFTVAVGDSSVQRDLGFGQVVAPRFVFRGDDILVEATVTATNLSGTSAQVKLKQGGAVLSTKNVSITDNNFATIQRFSIPTKAAGTFAYDVELPAAAEERNTRNNSYRFYVEVIESRKKIVVLAAAPNPDVAAIREALKKVDAYEVAYQKLDESTRIDAEAELAIVFIQENIQARFYQNALANYRGALWLVIGAGVDGRIPGLAVPDITIPRMRQPVVVKPKINPSFGLFRLSKPTQDVLTKLEAIPVFGGQLQTSQPSEALFSTADGFPLAIYGKYKGGRLAVFSLNGLWQQRMQIFKTYQKHGAFDEWMQLTTQYLTSESNSNRLRLYYEPRVPAGENLTIRAEVYDASLQVTTEAAVEVKLAAPDKSTQEYALQPRQNDYVTEITGLASGTNTFQASATLGNEKLVATGEFIVEEQGLEAMSTRANYNLLMQMASATEGKFYTLASLSELLEELKTAPTLVPVERIIKTSVPLINSLWLMFLAAFLFAAEWLLRRYFGRI